MVRGAPGSQPERRTAWPDSTTANRNTMGTSALPVRLLMATTMTIKGQVTIPKKVREALRLSPGDSVDFDVNREGQVVVRKTGARPGSKRDRFESARGKAQVKWRTDELMALLRGTE